MLYTIGMKLEEMYNWLQNVPSVSVVRRSEQLPLCLLHPIVVNEPWTVLGVDLIGPFSCTQREKQYIMTVTDLFTKWVIAKPLCNKSGPEVSQSIADVLLDFGLVEKIITDGGESL